MKGLGDVLTFTIDMEITVVGEKEHGFWSHPGSHVTGAKCLAFQVLLS